MVMDPNLTHFRVGPLPGDRDQTPSFAHWLADPAAGPYAMEGQEQLLAWISETWDDDLVEPLIASIDERNPAADHAFIAIKRGKVSKDQGCIPEQIWSLGQTKSLTKTRVITVILFKTTDEFANDEKD